MKSEMSEIVCLPNGTHYLLNDMTPHAVPHLVNARNEPGATVTTLAFCRCGVSSNKPLCGGSHWHIRFED